MESRLREYEFGVANPEPVQKKFPRHTARGLLKDEQFRKDVLSGKITFPIIAPDKSCSNEEKRGMVSISRTDLFEAALSADIDFSEEFLHSGLMRINYCTYCCSAREHSENEERLERIFGYVMNYMKNLSKEERERRGIVKIAVFPGGGSLNVADKEWEDFLKSSAQNRSRRTRG